MKPKPLIEDAVLFELLEARKAPAGVKGPENRLDQVFANAAGTERGSIYLYDAISYWNGNDARTFKARLDQVKAKEIDVYINSPGGGVFEGVTIYNLLAGHPARITVHIQGLAASIASVIALAGEEVNMAENAMMMIHNPSTIVWGEAADMRKAAEVLDRIKDAILNTYVSRTGLDRQELARAMDAETWYSADEAVKQGFATRKVSGEKAAAWWNGADFPGIPAEVRERFGLRREEGKEEGKEEGDGAGRPGNGLGQDAPATEEEPATEEPTAEEEPAAVGTVEDVSGAAALVAEMRRVHGL